MTESHTHTHTHPSQSELSNSARPRLESSRSAAWRQGARLLARKGSLWGVLTSRYGMISVLMLWLLPLGRQIHRDTHLQGKNSSPFHLLRRSLFWQPLGHLRWGLRPVCMWPQSTENTGLLLWLSFPGLISMLLWHLVFWVSLSQEPLSSWNAWNWICLPSCIWWMLLSIAYIGLIFFSLDSDHHVWCFLSISEWPNTWDLLPPVSQVVSVCRPSQCTKEACYSHGPLMQYSRA